MRRGLQGRFVSRGSGREQVEAFVPAALPPAPSLQLQPGDVVLDLAGEADRALGRLDGIATFLPDPDLFEHLHIRKEAVLSSRIEGGQASLPELFLFESGAAPAVPFGDVRQISQLVTATERTIAGVPPGAPFSLALLEQLYAEMNADASAPGFGTLGDSRLPGHAGNGAVEPSAPGGFRRHDISIPPTHSEAAPFVPAPGEDVDGLMGDLERFCRDEAQRTPTLVKAALAHHRFQTVQPFAEGTGTNGPLSRLLILLLLRADGALSRPLLYPSLHFKENREVYNDLLERVRLEGDWERWLAFFFEGLARTADHAAHTVRRIVALISEDRTRIRSLGRAADSALRVHDQLLRVPILTIPHAGRLLPLTPPTLSSSFRKLEKLGILLEVTGRARDRLFTYRKYLDILDEGTEPYAKDDLLARREAGRS